MKYTKIELSNGSVLGVINIPRAYPVTISAFIKAGFKYDPKDRPGLAHFTEHMLFDGTKTYPTPTNLAWSIERFGGWHYAFTWIEHQQHAIHLPKDNFEQGMKVLIDILSNSLLDKKEFEREKGMVKEEILRNLSDHEKAISDYAWQPLFFQGTSLARPYSGTTDDIDKLTLRDVNMFLTQHFMPESTVFLVAGDISVEKAVEVFEKYAMAYSNKNKTVDTYISSGGTERIKIFPSATEQVSIICGVRTVPFDHQDRHVLDLTKDLLGGYFGARLPQQLRKAGGLIYNWDIWQDNLLDTGYLIFKSATAPQNVYKFLELVLQEYDKLTKELVDRQELAVAKGHITGSLFSNIQTGFDFNNWYGIQELLTGKAYSLEEQAEIYNKIPAEEILKCCQKYFTKANTYIAVFGKADEQKIKNLFK